MYRPNRLKVQGICLQEPDIRRERMMLRLILAVMLGLTAASCASTAMKSHVGKSINEAFFAYGKPENVIALPDGRRAFQFRWGGGSTFLPGTSSTNVAPSGGGYTATTITSPSMIVGSAGCLVTLIARPVGNDFIVEEYRIPQRLVC
jgi:hypothetical protein